MSLTDLILAFNEYVYTKNQTYIHSQFPYPHKIHNNAVKNDLEDLLANYDISSLSSFTLMKILPKHERLLEDRAMLFAENLHGNFYYGCNDLYSSFFCVDFDGNYLWEISKSVDSFEYVFIVLLKMETSRLKSPERDLGLQTKLDFLNELIQNTDIGREAEEYFKYVCGITE